MKYKVKFKVCVTLLMMMLLISGTVFAKADLGLNLGYGHDKRSVPLQLYYQP